VLTYGSDVLTPAAEQPLQVRPRPQHAVLIASGIDRRLAVWGALGERGFRVAWRRSTYRIEVAVRFYAPTVIVIDAEALQARPIAPHALERLASAAPLFVLEARGVRVRGSPNASPCQRSTATGCASRARNENGRDPLFGGPCR
jgi:hypothetical protein